MNTEQLQAYLNQLQQALPELERRRVEAETHVHMQQGAILAVQRLIVTAQEKRPEGEHEHLHD